MLRLLGFVLNPIGSILWPVLRGIGGSIDRALGPSVGWYLALLLALAMAASFVFGLYTVSDRAGRLAGLLPPIAVQAVSGTIAGVEVLEKKAMTIRERLTVTFEIDGKRSTFEETTTEPSPDVHQVGDHVTVYVRDGAIPSVKDPNDPFFDVFVTAFATLVPFIFFVAALRYLAHRRRIFGQRPAFAVATPQDVVLRGNQRVLSTAERLRLDAERMRPPSRRR